MAPSTAHVSFSNDVFRGVGSALRTSRSCLQEFYEHCPEAVQSLPGSILTKESGWGHIPLSEGAATRSGGVTRVQVHFTDFSGPKSVSIKEFGTTGIKQLLPAVLSTHLADQRTLKDAVYAKFVRNVDGARQIDRAVFRRVAAELGSLDADIIGQVGEAASVALALRAHHGSRRACEHPEAAAKAIDAELEEQWALGPFYYPPTVPIRTLPRRASCRSAASSAPRRRAVVEDYLKPRVTLNPSRGDDSVNAGIDKAGARSDSLPRATGYSRIPF